MTEKASEKGSSSPMDRRRFLKYAGGVVVVALAMVLQRQIIAGIMKGAIK